MTAICCYLVFRERPVPGNGSIIIVIRHRLLLSCYESAISYCGQLYIRVTQREEIYSLMMKSYRNIYVYTVQKKKKGSSSSLVLEVGVMQAGL